MNKVILFIFIIFAIICILINIKSRKTEYFNNSAIKIHYTIDDTNKHYKYDYNATNVSKISALKLLELIKNSHKSNYGNDINITTQNIKKIEIPSNSSNFLLKTKGQYLFENDELVKKCVNENKLILNDKINITGQKYEDECYLDEISNKYKQKINTTQSPSDSPSGSSSGSPSGSSSGSGSGSESSEKTSTTTVATTTTTKDPKDPCPAGEKLINGSCQKVLNSQDCINQTSNTVDKYLPFVVGDDGVTCREMTEAEKIAKCKSLDPVRSYRNNKCLLGLNAPTITIADKDILHNKVTFTLNTNNSELKNNSVDDIKLMLKQKVDGNYVETESSANVINKREEQKFLIQILNLRENTTFHVKAKIETQMDGYDSVYGKYVEFKTKCDSAKYTDAFCKSKYGPINSVDPNSIDDKLKDPEVNSWPFFRKAKDDKCGCRELSQDEKKAYCKNTFFNSEAYNKITKESLIIDENSCKPGPAPLGAPTSLKLVNLVKHNQNMKDGKLITETEVKNYSKKPYRLLLKWNRPNIDETGLTEDEVAPTSYNIYRKKSSELDESSFVKIKSIAVTDKKQINYNWIDEELEAATKYDYKVTSVNKTGEGAGLTGSGTTIEERLTNEKCSTKFSNKPSGSNVPKLIEGGGKKDFEGFPMMLDLEKNECIENSKTFKTNFCKNQVAKISSPRSNTYKEFEGNGGCIALENEEIPGKSNISLKSKTTDQIVLNIESPSKFGMPEYTHYRIQYRNCSKFKSQTCNENWLTITDSQSNFLLPTNIIENNSNTYTHKGENIIKPGNSYEYRIQTVSSDPIWQSSNISGKTQINNFWCGVSDFSEIIKIQTTHSVPQEIPDINPVDPVSKLDGNKILNTILIDKFNLNKTGGPDASITHYKITKIFKNREDNTLTTNSCKKDNCKTYEIDLNNLQKWNNDNPNFNISHDTTYKTYTIKDSDDIKPMYYYNYFLTAKNNKVESYSTVSSVIKFQSENIDPILDLNEEHLKNIIPGATFYDGFDRVTVKFLTNNLKTENGQLVWQAYPFNKKMNTIKLDLKWNEFIDPNIKRFENIKQTNGRPVKSRSEINYKISYLDSDNIPSGSKNAGSNTNVSISDLNPEETYEFSMEIISKFIYFDYKNKKNRVEASGIIKFKIKMPKLNQTYCNNFKSGLDNSQMTYIYDDGVSVCRKRDTYKERTDYCKEKNPDKQNIHFWQDGCYIKEDGKLTKTSSKKEECIANNPSDIQTKKYVAGTRIIGRWDYTPSSNGGDDLRDTKIKDLGLTEITVNSKINYIKKENCKFCGNGHFERIESQNKKCYECTWEKYGTKEWLNPGKTCKGNICNVGYDKENGMCQICKKGYGRQYDRSYRKCVKCDPGQYTRKVYNVKRNENGNECTDCGWELKGTSAWAKPGEDCTATSCKEGYKFDTTRGNYCSACKPGYYRDPQKHICVKCKDYDGVKSANDWANPGLNLKLGNCEVKDGGGDSRCNTNANYYRKGNICVKGQCIPKQDEYNNVQGTVNHLKAQGAASQAALTMFNNLFKIWKDKCNTKSNNKFICNKEKVSYGNALKDAGCEYKI